MRSVFPLALLLFLTPAARAGDNWPQFRGPGGTGISDSTGLPTTWDEKTNVVWKTPIHDKGWSSPVVWGEQVWLTTAREDGKEFFAICVDRDTGRILHDIKLYTVEKPAFCIPFNSYASPTPVVEQGRVYVHFGTYGTACLDSQTGKVLWSRTDLNVDHWRGPGSSPVVWENLIFLTFDGYDRQYVAALDKHTGKTVWLKDRSINYKTDNGDLKKAYSTPSIITVGGKPQLVSPAAVGTVAYDPRTGKEIWKVHHGGMNAACPPVFGHGLLHINTGNGGFRQFAVRPDGEGDITESHVVWKYLKETPSRPSPLLDGELLYLVTDNGVVACLEAKTGNSVWSHRVNGKVTASPVLAEGRLYIFEQEDGRGYVVEAGAKGGKVLATNQLAIGCMASPAIAGKALFVRTKTHLYRIEQK
jgi:outer membrane protein assembly factor BamB